LVSKQQIELVLTITAEALAVGEPLWSTRVIRHPSSWLAGEVGVPWIVLVVTPRLQPLVVLVEVWVERAGLMVVAVALVNQALPAMVPQPVERATIVPMGLGVEASTRVVVKIAKVWTPCLQVTAS
jgi:hypothetical protein